MSKMVKIAKESDSPGEVVGSSETHYPYGTSLNFEDEMVEELGLARLEVGAPIKITGIAHISGTSEHEDENRANKSVSVQFTEMDVSVGDGDRAEKLYGGES